MLNDAGTRIPIQNTNGSTSDFTSPVHLLINFDFFNHFVENAILS